MTQIFLGEKNQQLYTQKSYVTPGTSNITLKTFFLHFMLASGEHSDSLSPPHGTTWYYTQYMSRFRIKVRIKRKPYCYWT